jgi:hypothetical protein
MLRIDILWPLEDFSVLSLLQGPLPWSPLRYVATLNFQSQIFFTKTVSLLHQKVTYESVEN